MDAFYASVELLDDPTLADKPFAVNSYSLNKCPPSHIDYP